MNEPPETYNGDAIQCVSDCLESIVRLDGIAQRLAADLEGACRRLAELGDPINSKPKSLVDWEKMKEGV